MDRVLPKVDISDPHTFLAIKRGILQYAWLKPLLGLATIIMKAIGVYQEGYIGLRSGYFWSGMIYNISVTVSLYSLGLFWVCMHKDLTPFRPVPKFLCVKLIIFASYWQGFFLSILVWLGAIPDDVEGYTPDNYAAAIQDALICLEMPIFAVAHWYAFSWHDFANNSILSARMPVPYALRDSFGIRDLVEDSKETFRGDKYGYRAFDSGDKIMAHESSRSRLARLKEGMRYERGGKAKYWIPTPQEINATTPLLGSNSNGAGPSRRDPTTDDAQGTFDELSLDPDEESLYDKARELEYGDWNVSCMYRLAYNFLLLIACQYPVITASEPLVERYLSSQTGLGLASPSPPVDPRRQKQITSDAAVVIAKKKKKKQKRPQQPDSSHSTIHQPPPSTVASSSEVRDTRYTNTDDTISQTRPDYGDSAEWGAQSEQTNNPTSPYTVGDEDEFQNVWGRSEHSSQTR
jgi:hypothetical protein